MFLKTDASYVPKLFENIFGLSEIISNLETMNLSQLLLTRLVLPFLLVAGMIAIPFFWLPDYEKTSNRSMEISLPKTPSSANSENHENNSPPNARAGEARRRSPFQKSMTLGFGLLLVSVTCGGVMLYGITRSQTVGWRRRFAPKKKKKKSSD